MLELAIRAPSAGHTQGWEFVVLDEPAGRRSFWSAAADDDDSGWLRRLQTAPVLVVCLSDPDAYLDRYAEPDKGWTDRATEHWPVPYWDVDVGMAAMILLLAAEESGLGACFFGVPGERWHDVRAALAIPARLRPVGMVALGTAVPGPKSPSLRRGRRPLESVVHWGTFRGSSEGTPAGSSEANSDS